MGICSYSINSEILFFSFQLEQGLKDGSCGSDLIDKLVQFPFLSTDIPWETKLGVLLGAKVIVLEGNCDEQFLTVIAPSGMKPFCYLQMEDLGGGV